jgi:endonuclease/exonuclease/phosphatase (EEP) superfamily protein YafD
MSKVLGVIVAAGLAASALLTAAGLLAYWRPALDIVNNGLPFLAVGCLALLGLAFAARSRALIVTAAILSVLNAALFLTSLPGFAPDAPDGSNRFLRVATFNLWGGNEHTASIVAFLDKTDADAVVLEEVRTHHKDLLSRLDKLYPHWAGDYGLVILSKYPILTDGRIDRAGQSPWMSLIIHWVRLYMNGTQFDLAGVHLARPFYPELQQADIAKLTEFVQSRSGPLILAGDFNMAPWTVKLKTFTVTTGLRRYNTFCPTWPMRWRDIRLLPLLPIDNVFASGQFTSLGVTVGPYLGSNHRPVIADITRSE